MIEVNVTQMENERQHRQPILGALIEDKAPYWIEMPRSTFLKQMESMGLPLSLESSLTRQKSIKFEEFNLPEGEFLPIPAIVCKALPRHGKQYETKPATLSSQEKLLETSQSSTDSYNELCRPLASQHNAKPWYVTLYERLKKKC